MQVSKTRLWSGRVLSGLIVVFLIVDSVMKVMKAGPAMKGTLELGFPESAVVGIGLLLLLCTLLYLIPRTAILGAILLTGYLGGAVAVQVRVGSPLFSNVLFPVYFGIMLWAGLYLRDDRLRVLISND